MYSPPRFLDTVRFSRNSSSCLYVAGSCEGSEVIGLTLRNGSVQEMSLDDTSRMKYRTPLQLDGSVFKVGFRVLYHFYVLVIYVYLYVRNSSFPAVNKCLSHNSFNPLKSKVKVTFCERARLAFRFRRPISLFNFTLVVSLSDSTGTYFHDVHARHLALKGCRSMTAKQR